MDWECEQRKKAGWWRWLCDQEVIDEGDVSGDDVSKKTSSKTRTSKIIKSRRISGASTLLQTSRSSCRDKRHQIAESRKSDDQIMMLCALCLEPLGNRLDNRAAQLLSQAPGAPKRQTNGRAVASPPGPCSRTVRTSPKPPIGYFLEFKKLHQLPSHYPTTKVCSSTVGSVLDIRRVIKTVDFTRSQQRENMAQTLIIFPIFRSISKIVKLQK